MVLSEIKLYSHQEEALRRIRERDNYGLFLEQGCGKTIPTLIRAGELLRGGEIENVLVVCPKPVIDGWWNDLPLAESYLDFEFGEYLEVTNYEQLISKNGKEKYMSKVWDMVVLDESHYIKNRSAKRTKACFKLGLGAKYRYILTGTPITNGDLSNIYSQFTFLQPYRNRQWIHSRIFGTWTNFCDKFCILNQWFQPYRFINVDKLQDIINENSYRVTKDEALDLPDVLPDKIFTIELKGKSKKKYDELIKHSTVMKYEYVADNSLARMSKLRQISSGFLIMDDEVIDLNQEKIKTLRDYLENYPDEKLVIFYEFNESFKRIRELLKKMKIEHIYLNSKQKDKGVWKDFQSKDEVKVAICQYRSANAGIDLYKASTTIFYEPNLSSNVLEQARGRTHRIGQKNKTNYIFFLTQGLEKQIYNSLQKYVDFSEKLFEEYIYQYTRTYHK